MIERETLTIIKAAEVVGVSRRTIYNWIRDGKVDYVRTAGGSIRIIADSLWRRTPPNGVATGAAMAEANGRPTAAAVAPELTQGGPSKS